MSGASKTLDHEPTKLVLPRTPDNTLNIYARTENVGVTLTGQVAQPRLELSPPANEAIREHYLSEGWAILPSVLSEQRIAACRGALEAQYLREGGRGGRELGQTISDPTNPGVRRLCNLFWKHAEFRRIATEPAIVDFARMTIGNNCKWQAMNAHDPIAGRKEAGQPLHADRMFFANCEGYCNAVIALDDFTVTNGATRVVSRSHKRPWPQSFTDVHQSARNESRLVCRAGDIIILHGDLWHSGMPNLAKPGTLRRGIHLGFACNNTRPQYRIREAFAPYSTIRAEVKELLPRPLDSFTA